jgi:hypothetical protein
MTRRKAPATPAPVYPAGFFTELIHAHRWPPRFEPRLHTINTGEKPKLGRPLELHGGWGGGTMYMPRTPQDQVKPAWMPRPAQRATR